MKRNARATNTEASDRPVSQEALAAFAAVIGARNLDTSRHSLGLAETATFATRQRVTAIARPADRDQVQACVRLANRFRVPLHPVSQGKNWGYGSRVPVVDGGVILSLERLRAIADHDERLAHVSVQPGVTFRQLNDFLRDRGSRLALNAPGSTPEASVVGNTVERGIVQGEQPDRCADICALEVVLPDGDCIRTGMAALPQSSVGNVQRWGLGPSLDGLFLQSNLGIVTAMTLWLQPLPAYRRHVQFTLSREAALEGALEALQRLRLEDTITTSIGLHNGDKILSLLGRYPYGDTGGATPLPDHLRRRALAAHGGGCWFGELALHAPTEPALLALEQRLSDQLGPVVDTLECSEINAAGPFFGGQAAGGLHNVYWRKPGPPADDMDPDRDRCGVIWHAPVIPFEAVAARRCVRIVEQILPSHGFEPVLSLQAISARCLYAVVSILYDRDRSGEDARATDCYRALAEALLDEGFPPYRLGLLGQDSPPELEPSTRSLLHRLKRTLDPNNILAPGRYDFGASETDPPLDDGSP